MRYIRKVLFASTQDLFQLGAAFKGKKTRGGGTIKSFSIEKLLHPTLILHVYFDIEGHPYKSDFYLFKREDEDEYRLEINHNKEKVGVGVDDVVKNVLYRIQSPVKVTRKIGTYKGWDLFETVNKGGHGGMAAKGDKWVGTDVSYTSKPKNTESQLITLIKD